MFYNPATAIYSQFLPPLRGSIGWGPLPGGYTKTGGCACPVGFRLSRGLRLSAPPTAVIRPPLRGFIQKSKFKIPCLRSGDYRTLTGTAGAPPIRTK